MKAWKVGIFDDPCATVVFAETRNKAKEIAMYTDACYDADYTEIQCNRYPIADKLYKPGMHELSWNDSDARIFLVKHGWYCDDGVNDECRECPAAKWCIMLKWMR